MLPGVVRVHRKLFKVNAHEFINGTSRILHNYDILLDLHEIPYKCSLFGHIATIMKCTYYTARLKICILEVSGPRRYMVELVKVT